MFQEALDAAARYCDISNLVIDENAKTVYLSDPDMSLDVGSVGKGYAVEMVAQAAEARGLKSALISVSVLSPDSGAADCLTTGLFCMSLEDGQKLIESLDGVEALWCTPDGEVIQSSGWADHEKK